MSASESTVKLIVELPIGSEPKPHKILGPGKIQIVKAVACRRRMHDSNIDLTSAPPIE